MESSVRSATIAFVIVGTSVLGLTGCLGDPKTSTATTTTIRLTPTVAPFVSTTEPPATTTTAQSLTYTVLAGDSIGKIATKLGVSAQSIIDANGLQDANKIQVGQKLRIPSAGGPTTSTVAGATATTAVPTGTSAKTTTTKA